MKICFTENGFEEYASWLKDKNTLKRINSLINSISRTPTFGIGKPEKLKDDPYKRWSRRINEKDRILYFVNEKENTIVITNCKGHYLDK